MEALGTGDDRRKMIRPCRLASGPAVLLLESRPQHPIVDIHLSALVDQLRILLENDFARGKTVGPIQSRI